MAKPKLTGWFHGSRKPKIEGVYERAEPAAFCGPYSYFDGERWGVCANTPDLAVSSRRLSSTFQHTKWRGLAEQPKEPRNG